MVGGSKSFGRWAATLVDSLDTLYILDMEKELDEAILAVRNVDCTKSEDLMINIFETTLRSFGWLPGSVRLDRGESVI